MRIKDIEIDKIDVHNNHVENSKNICIEIEPKELLTVKQVTEIAFEVIKRVTDKEDLK